MHYWIGGALACGVVSSVTVDKVVTRTASLSIAEVYGTKAEATIRKHFVHAVPEVGKLVIGYGSNSYHAGVIARLSPLVVLRPTSLSYPARAYELEDSAVLVGARTDSRDILIHYSGKKQLVTVPFSFDISEYRINVIKSIVLTFGLGAKAETLIVRSLLCPA